MSSFVVDTWLAGEKVTMGTWIGYAPAFLALAGIVWGALKAGNSPPINILGSADQS
jgi:hypothetical protein